MPLSGAAAHGALEARLLCASGDIELQSVGSLSGAAWHCPARPLTALQSQLYFVSSTCVLFLRRGCEPLGAKGMCYQQLVCPLQGGKLACGHGTAAPALPYTAPCQSRQ